MREARVESVLAWLVGAGVALGLSSPALGGTWYVDADSVGPGVDGSSWALAFPHLQDALAVAVAGDEIWVAEGVYYPDDGAAATPDDRGSAFSLAAGVAVLGGFGGDEEAAGERDPGVRVTVLSGDIDHETAPDLDLTAEGVLEQNPVGNVQGENAYHVVVAAGVDGTAHLDGVTITGGYADGSFPANRGGGVYNSGSASPTITRCRIVGNYAKTNGGGIYNHDGSDPYIARSTISGNSAGDGGGVYNNAASDPMLASCTVERNTAATAGGGIYNFDRSNPVIVNSSISWNTASSAGGGMLNLSNSHPLLVNCTVAYNSAGALAGGVINFGASNVHFTNVLIWANNEAGDPTSPSASIEWDSGAAGSTINYSLIARHNPAGTGNLNGIALASATVFVTPNTLRIDEDSPAVGGGSGAVSVPSQDLAGAPRFNGQIDIGAFELPDDGDGDGIPDGYEEFYTEREDSPVPFPDSDADGDGLRAVEEFGFGTNPNSPDSAQVTAGVTPGAGGTYLTLTYPRHRDSTEHVTFTVFRSSDLGVADPWALDTTTVVSVVPSADDPDVDIVTVRSNEPIGDQARGFLKLEVALIPETS